ncbi:MAG: DUF5615 family PIN-like protein [Anaerolineales bacterium]|nr:DUF5615 family PIN-like protein [Anaerolineales bacterium]
MISFYFDEMMSRPVARALEQHGLLVVMAIDVGMVDKDDDSEHLPFATEQGLVMVTLDFPFAGRTMQRDDHTGLVCWTGVQNDFGAQIRTLLNFAETHTPEMAWGQVFWLK